MPLVVFFHNVRDDNARRTGVSTGNQRLIDYFVPGDEEPTPALRWYFDLVVEVEEPPSTPDQARQWLDAHADEFRRVLTETADRLTGGIDTDLLPWTYEYRTADGPIRVSLSAMRRYDARHVANNLRAFLATDMKAVTDRAAVAT